jgi:hypothetical protein
MRALASQPKEALALGQAARRLVETRFAPDTHVRGILDIYAEAGATAASLVS